MLDFRIFGAADQQQFAALTGDFNPIHMDSIAARRTQAGAPVVHGIHTLLWLLDWIGARNSAHRDVTRLRARFPRMLYLDEKVEARIVQSGTTVLRAQACVDGVEVASVVLEIGQRGPAAVTLTELAAGVMPRQGTPAVLTLHDMRGLSGRVAFVSRPADMEQAFPGAARLLGSSAVAALGCSTYLVGMVVPGLHSLYDGLDLSVGAVTRPPDELRFAVTEVDSRFRRVRIQLDGGGLAGSLVAFSRAPPVLQPPMADVAKHVTPGEFEGSISLVIGGSRGLGELTSKLIAAGGGRTMISYASGRSDAERIAAEITEWGGKCEVIPYNVREDANRQLEGVRCMLTHLYYFATPQISRRKSELFSRERFERFNEYYVYGFFRLVEAIVRRAPEGVVAFYPSSVYVQDRPNDMTEYAMSKAAGEVLCAEIPKLFKAVRVLAARLPRLQTDQTASLIEAKSPDPLSILLPIVRKMHVGPGAD